MHDGTKPFRLLVSGALLATTLIAGCGGGGGSSGSAGAPPAASSGSGNQAPTITGTPPSSALQAHSFEFAPAASDPDQDKLTFTIANKPAWASFNSATGRLSGTPGPSDVGVYSDIEIAVTDGNTTTPLRPFTLNVVAAGAGENSATVQWLPPQQKTDGSPLVDLAGYKIYYGTSPGNYSSSVTVDGTGMTSYVVSNLPDGTFYFSVTALDSSGGESDRSPEVSKTFN